MWAALSIGNDIAAPGTGLPGIQPAETAATPLATCAAGWNLTIPQLVWPGALESVLKNPTAPMTVPVWFLLKAGAGESDAVDSFV